MVSRHLSVFVLGLLMLSVSGNISAQQRVYTPTGIQRAKPAVTKPPSAPEPEKPFAELIKDKVAIPGLFTFYLDTANNSVYMAVRPTQLDTVFLCGTTISKADGSFSDNGSMYESFPFYFKRVGKKIMMLEKNVMFRADTSSAFSRAISSGVSDHLYASTKVMSKPQDSTAAILVDASDLFVRDAENLSYFAGQRAQTGLSFDRDNSYFEKIKSFPLNSEIDVKLHFRSVKPLPGATLQNPYSLFHTFHYSLSTLPKTDFVSRLADDRVGQFLTMYEDYTNLSSQTPYVRYINRWNLKKKDPSAALSEPVEPIVYWVENRVPVEFRADVAKGIEFWNKAFEKIGYKNAIVAKQMPDTATWDPADVRYNTIRWMLQPGGGYAVGPSRANPYTGQIYDADVRISADFIRYMFSNIAEFIKPLSFDGSEVEDSVPAYKPTPGRNYQNLCNYESESAKEAAFGLAYVQASTDDAVLRDSLTKEYVHEYVTEVVAHEVGHTLGLRHNFKGSTSYTLQQIQDKAFTTTHSTTGSVMDYNAPNIAEHGKPQGEFYESCPGPYDDWAIAYAYTDCGGKTPEEDSVKLASIASKAPEQGLAYGTDEDFFGWSTRSVDPNCNQFDLGSDPLSFAEYKIRLTKDLWTRAIKEFEKPGTSYQKIRTVFQYGWRSYLESAQLAPKYIGGLYDRRDHIGDPSGRLPFQPIPAAEQRRAMAFLTTNMFAANAFSIPAELLNKLAPPRMPDFDGAPYNSPQLDYPFLQAVIRVQSAAIQKLYDPMTIGRLLNNLNRVPAGTDRYQINDMFGDVRKAIWGEAVNATSVNVYRRQLQLVHLNRLIDVYLSSPAVYPSDARTLAANDLNIILNAASRASNAPGVDEMSQAHFKEVARQIQAAQKAQREFAPTMMFGS